MRLRPLTRRFPSIKTWICVDFNKEINLAKGKVSEKFPQIKYLMAQLDLFFVSLFTRTTELKLLWTV